MGANFNKVILAGNLTHDPELRYIPSGTAVTDLRMAINDRRKNSSGQWVDEPVYVDVTLWGRTAEVACEYLGKGSNVLIEGRLKFDTWESNDGQKRSKLRVTGDRMQMLGGGRGGSGGGGSSRGGGMSQDTDEDYGQAPASSSSQGPPDDEIPF